MNNKVLPKWRDKTATEKILFMLQIFISILVIFFASLQIFNVWDKAFNVFEPLLGVNMLLLFMQYRKYDKLFSLVYLALAISFFIVGLKILLRNYY